MRGLSQNADANIVTINLPHNAIKSRNNNSIFASKFLKNECLESYFIGSFSTAGSL